VDVLTTTLMGWAGVYGPRVVGAIAILVFGWIAVKIVDSAVRRLMKQADPALSKFLVTLTHVALMVFVILAALNMVGVQTTSFIAVIGAAGLAIGLALQKSLANFAAGIMLIIFRPFKAGDFVEAGGTSGTIQEIHIFNTVLKTPDNKRVVVPNSNITGNNIINYSAEDTRRVDLVFGIGYGDDIRKAKEILQSIVIEDDRILDDPAPTIAVSELGDSSVNFVVRPWVKTVDYWAVYFDLTEKVKLTFDAEGISIPFPQRDVHLFQQQAPQ